MTENFQNSLEFARMLDELDELKSFRNKFFIPKDKNGNDVFYFCGNSLGLQPVTTRTIINEELDDWAKFGVEGHFNAKRPWKFYHEFLTESSARLVGAKNDEVVCMNSLTVNLNLMMVSFYRPDEKKYKIVIEDNAFPSDIYAVESQIKFHGLNPSDALIKLKPREGENYLRTPDIIDFINEHGESIALIMLGGVNYYTGQAFEMDRITEAGHSKGCKVGFDCAHAAGNLELKLHDWDVDFVVWCSYKYLNAGPGGVAGCFVNSRYKNDSSLPRFSGWWGHDVKTRFLMPENFEMSEGVEGWQISNPPIFQMAALLASLQIFDEAGISNLRKKSIKLTGFLEWLVKNNKDNRVSIITPEDKNQRGCQLSLRTFSEGKKLYQRLTESGVICDWREPDVIRVAPVPLYNSFEDVYKFSQILFNQS